MCACVLLFGHRLPRQARPRPTYIGNKNHYSCKPFSGLDKLLGFGNWVGHKKLRVIFSPSETPRTYPLISSGALVLFPHLLSSHCLLLYSGVFFLMTENLSRPSSSSSSSCVGWRRKSLPRSFGSVLREFLSFRILA